MPVLPSVRVARAYGVFMAFAFLLALFIEYAFIVSYAMTVHVGGPAFAASLIVLAPHVLGFVLSLVLAVRPSIVSRWRFTSLLVYSLAFWVTASVGPGIILLESPDVEMLRGPDLPGYITAFVKVFGYASIFGYPVLAAAFIYLSYRFFKPILSGVPVDKPSRSFKAADAFTGVLGLFFLVLIIAVVILSILAILATIVSGGLPSGSEYGDVFNIIFLILVYPGIVFPILFLKSGFRTYRFFLLSLVGQSYSFRFIFFEGGLVWPIGSTLESMGFWGLIVGALMASRWLLSLVPGMGGWPSSIMILELASKSPELTYPPVNFTGIWLLIEWLALYRVVRMAYMGSSTPYG